MKNGSFVKYNAPGWSNIIGTVYETTSSTITVYFGKKYGYIEFQKDEPLLIIL